MERKLKTKLKRLQAKLKLSDKRFLEIWSDIFIGHIKDWNDFPPDKYIERKLEDIKISKFNLIEYRDSLIYKRYEKYHEQQRAKKIEKPRDYLVEWGIGDDGEEQFVSASWARQVDREEGYF